jgi:hypothetical protein
VANKWNIASKKDFLIKGGWEIECIEFPPILIFMFAFFQVLRFFSPVNYPVSLLMNASVALAPAVALPVAAPTPEIGGRPLS